MDGARPAAVNVRQDTQPHHSGSPAARVVEGLGAQPRPSVFAFHIARNGSTVGGKPMGECPFGRDYPFPPHELEF